MFSTNSAGKTGGSQAKKKKKESGIDFMPSTKIKLKWINLNVKHKIIRLLEDTIENLDYLG